MLREALCTAVTLRDFAEGKIVLPVVRTIINKKFLGFPILRITR
jgi:hypothetical protein